EQLLCRRVPLEVWDKRSAGAAAVAGRNPPLPRLLGRRRADGLDSQIRARAAGGEVELVQAVADVGKKRANTALDPVLDDRQVPAPLVAGGCRGCERFLASASIGDDVRLGSLVLELESLEPRAERVGQSMECARQPFVTDARDLIVTRGGGLRAGVRSFRYCNRDTAAGRGAVAGVAVDPAGGERLVERVVGCSAVGVGVGASFAARIVRERGLGARGVGSPRASPVAHGASAPSQAVDRRPKLAVTPADLVLGPCELSFELGSAGLETAPVALGEIRSFVCLRVRGRVAVLLGCCAVELTAHRLDLGRRNV